MLRSRIWVGAVISCCALACAEDQERWPAAGDPATAPSLAKPSSDGTAVEDEVSVALLVQQMDAIGPNEGAHYAQRLAAFRRSGSQFARLKDYYAALPSTALGIRWKVIYLAGELESSEATSWLLEVALSQPEPQEGEVDGTFRLRYTAAMGIVRAFLAKAPGTKTKADVERLLDDADPNIAQLVGMELHKAEMLAPAWRTKLKRRGIAANFRAPTEAELAELHDVDPAKGARSSRNEGVPKSTIVPAEGEE